MKQRTTQHCDAGIWPVFVRQTHIYVVYKYVYTCAQWVMISRRLCVDDAVGLQVVLTIKWRETMWLSSASSGSYAGNNPRSFHGDISRLPVTHSPKVVESMLQQCTLKLFPGETSVSNVIRMDVGEYTREGSRWCAMLVQTPADILTWNFRNWILQGLWVP